MSFEVGQKVSGRKQVFAALHAGCMLQHHHNKHYKRRLDKTGQFEVSETYHEEEWTRRNMEDWIRHNRKATYIIYEKRINNKAPGVNVREVI